MRWKISFGFSECSPRQEKIIWRTLALARPDVEVRDSHNGKPLRRYRGDSASETGARLVDALGEEFSRNALRIERAGAGLRLGRVILEGRYLASSIRDTFNGNLVQGSVALRF